MLQKPIISLIAAVARGGIIGLKGSRELLWAGRFEADLKFFRATTKGKPVVMGRSTHESIGRGLPERQNIVITTQQTDEQNYNTPYLKDAHLVQGVSDLQSAFELVKNAPEIFVIGGAQVYAEAIKFADRIYLTELEFVVPSELEKDCVRFPEIDPAVWQVVNENPVSDGDDRMVFKTYERKPKP